MSSPNRLLLRFAFKYPWLVAATVILGFSGALFNGVGTALIVPLLLAFLGKEEFELKGGPPALQKVLSFFDSFPEEQKLMAMTGAVLLAIILKNIANYANSLTAGYLSRSLVNGMRLEGLRLLLDVDIDFYAKYKIGDIINRISTEVGKTAGAVKVAISMFSDSITILVFIAFLLSLSWQLTIVATFLLFLVALVNQYFIKRAKQIGRSLTKKSQEYSNKLYEILTGIRLIKTVSKEEEEYQKIKKIIREREQADFQAEANYGAVAPINEVSGIIALLLIVICGSYIFSQQLETVSTDLAVYLVLLFRLLPFMGKLNGARSKFANAVPSAEIIADFLNKKDKPFMVQGDEDYQNLVEGIKFEKVNFSYPNHEELVLKEIDLWIPKGKTIALVGSSGAGKSTLADLLPRFYDPTAGRITFDGKDLKKYKISSLRQAMGVVSQDTFLFNNTVRHNIAYGREGATEEQIIDAAKRANAYEFIMNLPKGFDTEIGDRGVMLSGGQRQRLAIARALLRDPDILILDEATSALDTVSERLVQEAIDELCRSRTTLVIAHRLSTVQRAYQIVVLEKGKIVEIGSHEELLEIKGGQYARLYEMQFSDKPKSSLPYSPALIRTSLLISQELQNRLSYEVRTTLNGMIGSLRLLTDDLIDTPEEQEELIEESYESAIRLLNTIEFFEEQAPKLPLEVE
ncbi:MAG: ABC transporter ATP-binding protein [Oscillatoria sp. PMC 1051.18]|nr:ABC transporter ATP-binding protein [Oscillatoria sp. PMC 1050.18]MEC5028659.1 ABC transporter ATP-binding protein [Oscillatoria sp. PMC 1051.18]